MVLQDVRILFARKLRSLVGVEDLRGVDRQSSRECLNAEGGIESDRDFPGENVPTVPVHDRHEVDEALPHGDISDVGGEHLIEPCYVDTFLEIGVHRMILVENAQLFFRSDVLKTHLSHEADNTLLVYPIPLVLQPGRHPGDAVGVVFHILPVNEFHEVEIEVGERDRLVIEAWPVETQEFALSGSG